VGFFVSLFANAVLLICIFGCHAPIVTAGSVTSPNTCGSNGSGRASRQYSWAGIPEAGKPLIYGDQSRLARISVKVLTQISKWDIYLALSNS
jgi:hypothetical protein